MSFYQQRTVFCPDDLCWLEVTRYFDGRVTIKGKQGTEIELCDGQGHQLQQMIDLLTGILGTYFPNGAVK